MFNQATISQQNIVSWVGNYIFFSWQYFISDSKHTASENHSLAISSKITFFSTSEPTVITTLATKEILRAITNGSTMTGWPTGRLIHLLTDGLIITFSRQLCTLGSTLLPPNEATSPSCLGIRMQLRSRMVRRSWSTWPELSATSWNTSATQHRYTLQRPVKSVSTYYAGLELHNSDPSLWTFIYWTKNCHTG